MGKQPQQTTLSYALLGLVHEEPRTGYDIRKIFQTTPMCHYSSSPGAIYPALKRLEKQGLITGEVNQTHALRPKRVFGLTAAGTESLLGWLALEISADDAIWRLDELMLRFAFHSFLGSDRATREFLRALARETDAYSKVLENEMANLPESTPIHGRLALESGVESYRVHSQWARRALLHFEVSSS